MSWVSLQSWVSIEGRSSGKDGRYGLGCWKPIFLRTRYPTTEEDSNIFVPGYKHSDSDSDSSLSSTSIKGWTEYATVKTKDLQKVP